jgi:hypothetical protein
MSNRPTHISYVVTEPKVGRNWKANKHEISAV